MEATWQTVAAVCVPAISLLCLGGVFTFWFKAVRGDDIPRAKSEFMNGLSIINIAAWVGVALALFGYFDNNIPLCVGAGVGAVSLFATEILRSSGISAAVRNRRNARQTTEAILQKLRDRDLD